MSRLARLLSGASYFFRGMGTLLRGGGIRRWALLPMLINSLLFMLLLVLGVWAAAHWAGGGPESGWWGTCRAVLAAAGAFLLIAVVSFFTFGMFATLIAAPFNELISQGTERILTGATGETKAAPLMSEILRASLSATKMFALEMAVVIPSLLLLLIPVIGAVLFSLPAGFFLALSFMDYSLDRRRLSVSQKVSFCWRNLAEVLGFGLVTYAVMLLPFVNVMAVPVGAAAGTRLFMALSRKEAEAAQGTRSPEAGAPSGSDSASGSPAS